jgi:hypothetical protein
MRPQDATAILTQPRFPTPIRETLQNAGRSLKETVKKGASVVFQAGQRLNAAADAYASSPSYTAPRTRASEVYSVPAHKGIITEEMPSIDTLTSARNRQLDILFKASGSHIPMNDYIRAEKRLILAMIAQNLNSSLPNDPRTQMLNDKLSLFSLAHNPGNHAVEGWDARIKICTEKGIEAENLSAATQDENKIDQYSKQIAVWSKLRTTFQNKRDAIQHELDRKNQTVIFSSSD